MERVATWIIGIAALVGVPGCLLAGPTLDGARHRALRASDLLMAHYLESSAMAGVDLSGAWASPVAGGSSGPVAGGSVAIASGWDGDRIDRSADGPGPMLASIDGPLLSAELVVYPGGQHAGHYHDYLARKMTLLGRAEGAAYPGGVASYSHQVEFARGTAPRPAGYGVGDLRALQTDELALGVGLRGFRASSQVWAFWVMGLLGPSILALFGLGSSDLWLSLAIKFWISGFAAMALLMAMYAQGLGAIWYTMAEFLVPTALLSGIGCVAAGVLVWKR